MVYRQAGLVQAGLVLVVLALIGATSGRTQGIGDPSEQRRTSTVGVVSADGDPSSIRILDDLAAALSGETIRILPVLGKGPVQNVGALFELRGADVSLVPSDVLPYLLRERRIPDAGASLRYIARLYDEEVHVLAGRGILSLADLAGKRVNLGPRDSRAYVTGSVIFGSSGIDVVPVSSDERSALAQLLRGEIAALVHVGRSPARLFFDLHRGDGVHFLPIPLTEELSRVYSPARLGIEDYPLLIGAGEAGRGEPVGTVAVPTVLAVYDWPPGTEGHSGLSLFTDALFLRARALQGSARDRAWKDFDPAADVPGWLRFVPAEARPAAGVAAERAPSPRPTARRGREGRQQEALFQQFLRWQQQQPRKRAQEEEKKKQQEALFQQFFQWREQHPEELRQGLGQLEEPPLSQSSR